MEKLYQRKTIRAGIKDYDMLADINDIIEVTEWETGDGFDVYISTEHWTRSFMVTLKELKIIRKLIKKLDKWDGE